MSLGEDFPNQQKRCRELIRQYQEIQSTQKGVNCSFAIMMIEDLLTRADKAVIEGDTIAMISIYEEMKGCE